MDRRNGLGTVNRCNSAVLAMKKPFSFGWEKGDGGGYETPTFIGDQPYCRLAFAGSAPPPCHFRYRVRGVS